MPESLDGPGDSSGEAARVIIKLSALDYALLLAIAHGEFLPAVPAIPPETEVLPSGPAPSAAPRSALPAGMFAMQKERRHGA